MVTKAVIFDVRVEPRVITTTTGSKDLQNVSLTLRVLSRPEVRKLPTIYQTLGLDYGERVLPAIGNEILKSIVAQFDAAELITQRGCFCQNKTRVVKKSRRVQYRIGRCVDYTYDIW